MRRRRNAEERRPRSSGTAGSGRVISVDKDVHGRWHAQHGPALVKVAPAVGAPSVMDGDNETFDEMV